MTDESFEPDHEASAEKIRSGEYFREARSIYSNAYVDPMAERYLYLIVTGITLLVTVTLLFALAMLFPIVTPVPFTVMSENTLEERPVVEPLTSAHGENTNLALQRFLVGEYVTRRETYDINTLDFNVRFVKAQSSEEVFNAWQKLLDPSNMASPITQFQRHSTRKISVISVNPAQDGSVDVTFDAMVEGQASQPRARMTANIAFQYADVSINQDTGATTPLKFIVTDYKTRRLQD